MLVVYAMHIQVPILHLQGEVGKYVFIQAWTGP
jgi:hypothetical protein